MSLLSQRAVNEGGEGWTLPLDPLLNSSSMVPCSAGDEIRNSGRGKEKVYIAVADPGEVHWVPWNPSFKGLPSKISVLANVLHTLRSH